MTNHSTLNITTKQPVIHKTKPNYIHPDFQIMAEEHFYTKDTDFKEILYQHENFIWIKMTEGELRFGINEEDVSVSQGEILFINSNQLHSVKECLSEKATCKVLLASPSLIKNEFLEKQIQTLIKDERFPSIIIKPIGEYYFSDFDAIFDLYFHKPQAYEFEILSRYISMFRQIYRVYSYTSSDEVIGRDIDKDILKEMIAYINDNYRDEITIDQLCSAGNISRSKCSRLFRDYLHISPLHFIQQTRLEKSLYLLKNTSLHVSEISNYCGFNQQSYFNRLFMRKYGMTPKEYRRIHTENDEQ